MYTDLGTSQSVDENQPIKPWLALGPVYHEVADRVDGLSLFENPTTDNGLSTLQGCIEEGDTILASTPKEGTPATLAGQTHQWELVRRPEKVLMWGRYNISNHLGAVLLATHLRPKQKGRHTFEILTPISSRARVYVNDVCVFDTEEDGGSRQQGTHTFQATLKEGDNKVCAALYRIGRMAQVGLRLTCNRSVKAQTALPRGMSRSKRDAIEQDLGALRLERDIYYEQDAVGLRLDGKLSGEAKVVCGLIREDKTIKKVNRQPSPNGFLSLARGKALDEGGYQISVDFEDVQGHTIVGSRYDIIVTRTTPQLTGTRNLERRKKMTLEHNAGIVAGGRNDIWPQVARYALEQYDEIDESAIRDTCVFIQNRLDCSDFVIQGVLRILYWDQERNKLSPEIKATMKDTILSFRYWADEPGDDVMYMGSENHRLLFHVAEYLGGQLFPLEEFTNSRQRGLYHVTKSRMFLMEWLNQRGRYGFDEWHSNSYYPVNIAPLLNLRDFAEPLDYKIRLLTDNILHSVFFNLGADSLHGVFGTTHGRSYARNLVHPDMEGTSSTCWLLFGEGSLRGGAGMSPVSLATSGYRLPDVIEKVATDRRTVSESRQQQGIQPGSPSSANFVVYRTPDYMVSGLQDHRKGEYESSTHVAQITMEDRTVIFFSCPHTSGEGGGLRPDYWSGHTTLPRVIQHRNVLSHTWHLSDRAWMTHCFFEPDRFDEVVKRDNWVFGRKNKGYVAIWSENGSHTGRKGQYAGRELICPAEENTWLVECGREADAGSFKDFIKSIGDAVIESRDGAVTYNSPSIGRFVTGWDVMPTVEGEPIQTRDYELLESPYGESDYGSGEMTLRHGKEKLRLFFKF